MEKSNLQNLKGTKGLEYAISDTRIIHNPNQVKSPDELKIGQVYLFLHVEENGNQIQESQIQESYPGRVKAINRPEKGWFIATHLCQDGSTFEAERSMADLGIIPYKDGGWNIRNYLVPKQ